MAPKQTKPRKHDPVSIHVWAKSRRHATELELSMCRCPWREACPVHPEAAMIEDLGRALALVRIAKGIKQRELAEMTGINQSKISSVENGTFNPGIRNLMTYARKLRKRVVITLEDIDE